MQRDGLINGCLGVARQQRTHFKTHPTIHAAGERVNWLEQIGGLGEVGDGKLKEKFFAVNALGKQIANLRIVIIGASDGLLKDRWIAGQTHHAVGVDVFLQLPRLQHAASNVVDPNTLTGD